MNRQPSRRRAAHRRGSAYLLVLSVAMVVTVFGLAGLSAARIRARVTTDGTGPMIARIEAQSFLDVAVFRIMQDATWREKHVHGEWSTPEPTASALVSFKLEDDDGDLNDDATDRVRVFARAEADGAVRVFSVELEPETPPNLLTNPGFEAGVSGWTGSDAGGTCTLEALTDTPHAGAAYLNVTARSAETAGPSQDVTAAIVNGDPLFTSVWLRGTVSSNTYTVALHLETDSGQVVVGNEHTWWGTDWSRVSATFTPTWSGTLISATWKITSSDPVIRDVALDEALLIAGDAAPSADLEPVRGTWRREVE